VRTIVRGKNIDVPESVREYAERKTLEPTTPPTRLSSFRTTNITLRTHRSPS
jgi:ribosome-associated translation inhibitor RaiA